MKKKILISAAVVLSLILLLMGYGQLASGYDFDLVQKFEKPFFARQTEQGDGLGAPEVYEGLGYEILVYGDLSAEKPYVLSARLYVGKKLKDACMFELGR